MDNDFPPKWQRAWSGLHSVTFPNSSWGVPTGTSPEVVWVNCLVVWGGWGGWGGCWSRRTWHLPRHRKHLAVYRKLFQWRNSIYATCLLPVMTLDCALVALEKKAFPDFVFIVVHVAHSNFDEFNINSLLRSKRRKKNIRQNILICVTQFRSDVDQYM